MILVVTLHGRAEKFLAEHLGGRAEAFDGVEGATAQFPLLAKESTLEA